jgi:hypothetical protein
VTTKKKAVRFLTVRMLDDFQNSVLVEFLVPPDAWGSTEKTSTFSPFLAK